MKKIVSLFIILGFFFLSNAQGIKFANSLSWEKVKQRARMENKYIFVDCYATWCGPCKMMDEKIYPVKEVGDAYNDRFISVKVQVDRTPDDLVQIKAWYKDAAMISTQYNIQAFPTLLFFSPEGKLIYTKEGGTDVKDFISLADKAINSEKDNLPMIDQYRKGTVALKDYPEVENKARAMGNDELAKKISLQYIRSYLNKLSDDKLLTEENYKYLRQFRHASLLTSKDKIFQLSLKKPEVVASSVKIDNGKEVATGVIYRNLLASLIKDEKALVENPSWEKIASDLQRTYGKYYADHLVPSAKKEFYFKLKRWKEFADAVDELIAGPPNDKGIPYGGDALNNDAWYGIFLNSDDTALLRRAIQWMDFVLLGADKNSNDFDGFMDTYANLIYKSGEIERAIKKEQEIVDRIVQRTGRPAEQSARGYLNTIDKMKAGEPTWSE